MRRVRYYEYGGPEVLTVEEAETPVPGEGQVLVDTEVVAASFVDTKFRRGGAEGTMFHRPLPGLLHGEVVGTVRALGPGVDSVRAGDRVAALVAEDAVADEVLLDTDWLLPVPAELDASAASALPMAAPVALRLLRCGQLATGETVLVHSASGTIGHLTVQLAKLLGAGTVIATASTQAKLDFAREQGADIGVDYSRPDWPDQVRAAAPGGVDLILDAVGGPGVVKGLDLLAPFGRTVLYGAASGELPDLPFSSFYPLRTVTGFGLFPWRAARPEQARAEIAELTEHLVAGRLRVAVHTSVPLEKVAEAHRLLEERAQCGRVMLVP